MIYAVQGSTGSYEDRQEWIVGYTETRAVAEAWAAVLQAAERAIMADWEQYARRLKERSAWGAWKRSAWGAWKRERGDALDAKMREYDPQFWWDLGTDYEVVEFEKLADRPPKIDLGV
jgi:hypothetical protein